MQLSNSIPLRWLITKCHFKAALADKRIYWKPWASRVTQDRKGLRLTESWEPHSFHASALPLIECFYFFMLLPFQWICDLHPSATHSTWMAYTQVKRPETARSCLFTPFPISWGLSHPGEQGHKSSSIAAEKCTLMWTEWGQFLGKGVIGWTVIS